MSLWGASDDGLRLASGRCKAKVIAAACRRRKLTPAGDEARVKAPRVVERLLGPESPWQRQLLFIARRFVAGATAGEALDAVERLNRDGLRASLDVLGEDVHRRAEAERARNAYLALLRSIRERGVDANVSVKLSALGLGIDETFAEANLAAIVGAAGRTADPFVRVDMEGSATTDATLRVVERTFRTYGNVGPVLQAALKRTPDDLEHAIALGMRVRLCKGAYREPATIAHRDPAAIRRAFLRGAEALLTRGTYPAIATHDVHLVSAVRAFAQAQGIGPDRFEFQLLYGVRPELQADLVRQGFRVRVYVPFGTHWAAYFYRRITERRENALFALRALLPPPPFVRFRPRVPPPGEATEAPGG